MLEHQSVNVLSKLNSQFINLFTSYRERREKERKDKEKRDFVGSKDGRDIRGDSSLHREHLSSSKPSKCECNIVRVFITSTVSFYLVHYLSSLLLPAQLFDFEQRFHHTRVPLNSQIKHKRKCVEVKAKG